MSEDVHEHPREEGSYKRVLARQEGAEALTPWVPWVLAPAAWALHQGIGYAMIPWLCHTERIWPYQTLTGVAIVLCISGALAAFHALHRSRKIRPERSEQRMKMMALVGLMFSAAAFGGIAVEYAGLFWIDVCASV